MSKKLTYLAPILFLAACAHHPDVRPGADGVHRVVITSEEKEGGQREALRQANDFCGERKLAAAVVEEKTNYTGSMSESDYQTGKTVSKVVQGVGAAGVVFGGKNEKNAGGVAAIGGGIAGEALGKGYTTEMRFKCM
jgi:hypothetical protein